jgi:hypothetical protein
MRIVGYGLIIPLLIGCSAPRGPRVVEDPDLDVKVPAIKQAVRAKDFSQAKQLVADLSSDDPAVRFYAINGLEKLTGQTFGYVYYQDEARREQAVRKWKAWLAECNASTQKTL